MHIQILVNHLKISVMSSADSYTTNSEYSMVVHLILFFFSLEILAVTNRASSKQIIK